MIVIGIDPGTTSGGWAIITDTFIEVSPMPDILSFADMLEDTKKVAKRGEHALHVFIEKAQSFPGQGISSAFNYGCHFGELLGVIAALVIPHTLVHPAKWTKVMLSGTKAKDKPKARNIEAARRLFPEVNLVADGCRTPHTGMVDALLIAEYGKRSSK